ncbi:single-stranded-DNA-specific exonuclease RecJ [Pelobacter propionicus]|uniref:Single-stranded-DNA-specific exonuclease RecJ n=1 Tax=Pelobacter propionicus (strain DSM 2379 / NBRC 103807 / OttBd1) TaxID=338966 RepID=A1APY7_PELPD|nr:single-stranded-DNA-specific exonuclease RecJ [Pelobacter propionicus]ABK99407.1 exonuclease RecJ [Pelobacter propionicus DSM 2379]
MQKKQWIVRTAPVELPAMAGEKAILPLTAAILAGRGISEPDAMDAFLSPSLADMLDPSRMKGMADAVARLLEARRRQEKITVYGDYDVDGITGTTLLVSFLRQTGFDCDYFIPNRFDDGYGLNGEALDRIINAGAALILSVDCGITAVEEALFCRQRGAELIIVDHHAPKETLPDACAVLNPLQSGCDYAFKCLAGVGVAFNLLVALRAALRDQGSFGSDSGPDLRQWLDLVALGTIADVVPLIGQNRIYVTHGLRLLAAPCKPGIQALKKVAGVGGAVSSGQVGFRLAPRLNAAGRMESAVPGVELLLGDDPPHCLAIAEELDAANGERQAIERAILQEAISLVEQGGNYPDRRSIVLASPSWHQGVVGIVASRLAERFHRPTILIALDEQGQGKGSGRSIPGFHLLDALKVCSPLLERFGGHRHAVGVSLSGERVDDFSATFEAEARRLLGNGELMPRLDIDAEAEPREVTKELALELKRLEPFGMGNPEPLLMMRSLTVLEQRVVGEDHLRLRLSRDDHVFNAIAFRMASRTVSETIDIAFFPEMNQWNGSSTLQLRVKDLRPTE